MAAGRIDVGFFASINGEPQWLTLRGDDAAHPAILIIAGAGAALSRLAPLYAPWEQDFTVAQWDQPGAGATFARNGEPDPFTLERLAADGVAAARAVTARLDGAPLILMGISGGSVTALCMLRAAPDLFAAYVGVGQVVNWAAQEALSWRLVLDRARAAGDAAAVAELEGIGPPPWADMAADRIKSKYANALTAKEQAAFAAIMPQVMAPPAGASWIAPGLAAPDAQARGAAGFAAVRPQLQAFDARALGLSFPLPMVFLQGAEDLYTVTALVEAYAAEITAPAKRLALIDGAGHGASFLADDLLALLKAHVRPLVG